MASMRHATLYLIFLCLLFHLTTATKYDSWADIPDCAVSCSLLPQDITCIDFTQVYCIKYWTITAQGSSCHAEDPMCYCTKSAWYFSMKNCLYNDSNSGCKTSQSTKNKDGILSYVDDIFCRKLLRAFCTRTCKLMLFEQQHSMVPAALLQRVFRLQAVVLVSRLLLLQTRTNQWVRQ